MLHPRVLSAATILTRIAIISLLSLATTTVTESFVVVPTQKPAPSSLQAHFLNTAWEWLVDERFSEPAYQEISLVDPCSATNDTGPTSDEEDDGEMVVVPLYPLPATYLPVIGINHTLNNVEPRNIKMAIDLMNSTSDRRFCAVLRLLDTGRIVKVGTLMRILDVEEHRWEDGTICRIIVNCRVEEIVDIISIENAEVESSLNKLKKSPDYLRARVRVRRRPNQKEWNESYNSHATEILNLVQDYNEVRSMYNGGLGTNDVPPFARPKLVEAMLVWTLDDFADEPSFWKAAHVWQIFCNTVREGRQISLSADTNEIMVAEAAKKGGPLQLPIHMEDLPPDVQRNIQLMEVERQKDFLSIRLDPCLDFLALLSMTDNANRITFLSQMVTRERERLQELASRPLVLQDDDLDETTPPKGAWFNDDNW